MALGVTLFYQGKLEPALAQFRRGLELFDPNISSRIGRVPIPACYASSTWR
jgi:hypothetical protein